MDLKSGTGSLECRLCGASYQMPIHHLHEPIDVFSEWLDDCEAAQQGRAPEDAQPPEDHEDDDLPGDDHDDDDLGQASGLSRNNNNNNNNKSSAASSKQPAQQAPSYSALGLDDSDDSDDE